MRRFALLLPFAALLVLATAGAAADTLEVRLVSQTSSTVTLGWDPQPGYGYMFSADGALVSRTNDPQRSTVRFSKSYSTYEVAVIVKGAAGVYPPAAVADTEAPTVAMTAPPNGSTVSSTIAVSAVASDNVGVARVEFFRDGVSLGSDTSSPYTVNVDTTSLANGSYTFGARAYDDAGNSAPAPQVSVTVANGTPPPTGGDRFVAPNGSDANPCTAAAPCLSFNRAYDVAANGDTVEVAGGAYGVQRIVRDEKYTTADTPDVVFQPAAGATVTVGNLEFGKSVPVEGGTANGPSNVTVKDMHDNGGASGCDWYVGTDAYWVTIVNGDACNLLVEQAKHTTVLGGDWGPCTVPGPCSNMKIVDSPYVTFDGLYVHDFRIVPGSGEHFECMFIVSGRDITVRNSRFENCEYYDIFVQRYYGTLEGFLLIERNTFGVPWDGQGDQNRPGALAFSPRGEPFRNVTVKCNVFAPGTGISLNDDGDGTVYENFVVIPAGDPSC